MFKTICNNDGHHGLGIIFSFRKLKFPSEFPDRVSHISEIHEILYDSSLISERLVEHLMEHSCCFSSNILTSNMAD